MSDEQLSPDAEIAIHLVRAGREILAAAKSAIDGLDAVLAVMEERMADGSARKAPVEAIPIRRTSP